MYNFCTTCTTIQPVQSVQLLFCHEQQKYLEIRECLKCKEKKLHHRDQIQYTPLKLESTWGKLEPVF